MTASALHSRRRAIIVFAVALLVVVGGIFLIRAIVASRSAPPSSSQPRPPQPPQPASQALTLNLAPGATLHLDEPSGSDALRAQLQAMQNDLNSISQGQQLVEQALGIPTGPGPAPAPTSKDTKQPGGGQGSPTTSTQMQVGQGSPTMSTQMQVGQGGGQGGGVGAVNPNLSKIAQPAPVKFYGGTLATAMHYSNFQ